MVVGLVLQYVQLSYTLFVHIIMEACTYQDPEPHHHKRPPRPPSRCGGDAAADSIDSGGARNDVFPADSTDYADSANYTVLYIPVLVWAPPIPWSWI